MDGFYGAQRLEARRALHRLIHGADAHTLVHRFVLLRDLVSEHDQAHFKCAILDDDRVELSIHAPGHAKPIACVQVPHPGTFRLEGWHLREGKSSGRAGRGGTGCGGGNVIRRDRGYAPP